jgi:hypothetical protein
VVAICFLGSLMLFELSGPLGCGCLRNNAAHELDATAEGLRTLLRQGA